MNLEQEVLLDMDGFYPKPIIINEWEPVADLLSDSFNWKGSKIDWKSLKLHVEKPIDFKSTQIEKDVEEFIEESGLYNFISSGVGIFYINDSSLDFAVSFDSKTFMSFVIYVINNIPQHHYFFDKEAKWCFAITAEGYLDFGIRG
ncbi:type IV secretion protein Rhs [Pantoea sp. EKM101V]|uniref:type IV secretion protein Rhs n=1 Tax=Pantoea sp. EKM101V TaxID=1683695 RepID=UPI0021042409|nr:type IV secretion protein Rhs [Pantoea sp. EKM101V]